jgi:DNA-binding transcriptional ArsR family regulator
LSGSRSTSSAERELAEVEEVFAALAHASRRHILLVLRFRGGAMTAGEIADRFSCSWPTTTRHLRVLEAAGLVQVEQRGRGRIYRLATERLLRVTTGWLRWFEAAEGPGPPEAARRRSVTRARSQRSRARDRPGARR